MQQCAGTHLVHARIVAVAAEGAAEVGLERLVGVVDGDEGVELVEVAVEIGRGHANARDGGDGVAVSEINAVALERAVVAKVGVEADLAGVVDGGGLADEEEGVGGVAGFKIAGLDKLDKVPGVEGGGKDQWQDDPERGPQWQNAVTFHKS